MYNRYVPQADGSYRRNRVPESRPSPPPLPKKQEPCPPPPCPPTEKQVHKPDRKQSHVQRQDEKIGSFLKQLLPKDFDTGDLIVILLLLLLAGDCEEDRNNALLTMALYFMM